MNKKYSSTSSINRSMNKCKKELFLDFIRVSFNSLHLAAVHVVPKKPIAALFYDKKYYLMDTHGMLYRSAEHLEEEVATFYDVIKKPLQFDLESSTYKGVKTTKIRDFIESIQKYDVLAKEIYYTSERGFQFYWKDIKILIGNDHFDQRLQSMFKLVDQNPSGRISSIELDYKGKAFVRTY